MALVLWLLVVSVAMKQGVKAEPICEVQGQVVVECAGCQATCADPEPPCLDICETGCACPAETPVLIEDAEGLRCGVLDECVVAESAVEGAVTEAPAEIEEITESNIELTATKTLAESEEAIIEPQTTKHTPVLELEPVVEIEFVPEKEAEPEEPEMNAVFFSAYTTAEDSNKLSMDRILPFSGAFSNLGDSFDTETSVFVCPTTGYYAFSVTMSGVNGGLGVAIVCDEEVISPLAFSTEAGAMYTNTVAMCKEGQKVYAQVKLQYGSGLLWNTVNGLSLNGFSGKLILRV